MFSRINHVPKILLIDDDSEQIKILNQALNELGDVFFEQDSLNAFNMAMSCNPDLILLDIEMPSLNGYQVLEQLKANEKTCQIPVIFITAHSEVEHQLYCLANGAVDFIAKPLHPEVVVARVNTQLLAREREKQLIEWSQHAKTTLDCIGDGVITTDKLGIVTFINPAAELIIGVTNNNAIGHAIEQIMPLRGLNDTLPQINPIRLAIADSRATCKSFNYQVMKKNGLWITIENNAAPLISKAGNVNGAVIVFDDIDEMHATAIKISHSLHYDELTNLPNRFMFMERLDAEIARCASSKHKLGLIMFDIDRFKLINEEFGFEFGDLVLKRIAQSLQSMLSKNEILSRHNADAFMVLQPGFEQPSDLANLAITIKKHLLTCSDIPSEINNLSMSIGLSIYPDDALDGQSLMLHADAALHRAKADPSHEGCCFYSEEMELVNISRRQRYMQLKKAMTDSNIVALYQPIVDAKSGQLKAVEALMRIRGDDGSLIAPSEFIPLAEETRLIIPLGKAMIELALTQLNAWSKQGLTIRMCLNISPVQFKDPKFIAFLINAIEQHGISSSLIELEVTESMMLEDQQKLIDDLQLLRSMGVSISIDDFGTGFSCLSYLNSLPVDVLKIDKSFVALLSAEQPSDILVKTIATLAQSMNFNSVAEGVESIEQACLLNQLGVTFLQGYLFSCPVVANEIKGHYKV
ncbi:hypothetical protein CW745_00525 [Psychromonas sp. psych-6C06]|uniref:two-component system response regulator n=1 Tax=Psychromonas sp. psych-6C06 TaxID=2058089 RepID=UPI000C33DD0D|nr:EAL domain-containing protein [Psychromonas sp. psych-6C06]PKF63374.1 hypothetical protein CW745_00525 [Psychromonas sp. psych-6C06]